MHLFQFGKIALFRQRVHRVIAGDLLNFRKIVAQFLPQNNGRDGVEKHVALEVFLHPGTIGAVGLAVKTVEGPFVPHIERQQDDDGCSDGQAGDIDEAGAFVFEEIAEGEAKVVL